MFLIYCIDENNSVVSFSSKAFLEPGIQLPANNGSILTIVDIEPLNNCYDESLRY